MNKPLLKLALTLLGSIPSAAQDCSPAPRSGAFLAYAIEPDRSGKAPGMRVDLYFRLPGVRNISLQLPAEWQGQRELYKAIHEVEAVSDQTVLQPTADPARRQLTFPLGQMVHIRYRAAQDWEGAISAETYFRAIFEPSFFQLTGRNFLVYPAIPEDQVLPISVAWKNLPAGWVVASNLGSGTSCQSATTRLVSATNGLFVGGDGRLLQVQVHGKPVAVAIRGKWDFTDEEFAGLAAKVLGEERAFWHDFDAPYYLISLLPSEETPGSYAGTALENSFTMFMSQQAARLDFDMKFVLAHQMFHSWNSGKLGEVPAGQPPFWLIEGFTDYYARALLRRAGLISWPEYIEDTNSSYLHYRTSPVVSAKDQLVREQFYLDADLQRLAYQRGGLLAATWDSRIRQQSQGKQSLDDAMLALRQGASRREQVLTESFLGDHFARFAGAQVHSDLTAYIDDGEIIPLPPGALGPCIDLHEAMAHAYDAGLDVEKMVQTRVISGVKPGSEADLAGVRNGQIVIERSEIRAGDPDQRISLTVRDNTGEKSLGYFHRGRGIPISQYQWDPEAAGGHENCSLTAGP
jgi:predicted metalloprotease with PDZ domain